MKKTILYIVLLITAAGIVFFIKNKSQPNQVADNQNFAVENPDLISKIFMADKGNQKVELERHDGYWMVNDKYKAMKAKTEMLLETLIRVNVKYPVSKAEWNSVIKDLATRSTKIELYEKAADKPFKVYHVGGNTSDSRGYLYDYGSKRANSKPSLCYVYPGV